MSDGACYLIWEAMDGGTISYVYTKTAPASYMAMGSGGKAIPAHRFSGNGKTKLKNKCSSAKDFYQCWCQWLKEMKKNGDTVEMNEYDEDAPHKTMIVLHTPANKVIKCGATIDLSECDAVAAVPPQNQDFNSPSMEQGLFLSKPRASYGGLAI